MSNNLLSVLGSIATVALIAIVTRWLSTARGVLLPKVRGGATIYGIAWHWRAIGTAGVAFAVVISAWSWHDLHRPEWSLLIISLIFAILGIWIASGSVSTNQSGITRKMLWHSRSVKWTEITEVRLHKKQGGAIELRSGRRKLIIDSRINAFQHLIADIEAHTHLPCD